MAFVIAFLTVSGPAAAQFSDHFDDGDFTSAPEWIGMLDRWQIGDLDGSALQSMGAAGADTIHIATSSEAAHGSWHFTFAHAGVNLSSFNGARIFFVSDRPDAREGAVGYYLQLGTNNSDRISLWRSDGDLSTGRTEIARSENAEIAGESSLIRLRVDRSTEGRFRVYANDSLLLAGTDVHYRESAYFVLWLKHTQQGSESFFFDNFLFEPTKYEEPSFPLPDSADIVLNEIHFNPPPGASEFIELYNRGGSAVDLRSLRIRDAVTEDVPITTTPHLIEPGALAVLVQDSAAFASEFRRVPFVAVSGWPTLNNTGDAIVLSSTTGVMDSLWYDEHEDTRGRSIERIDPDAPTEMFNFAASVHGFGSTPGERNSVHFVDVTPPHISFVEQVDSFSFDIHFSEDIRTDELLPETFDFGAEVRDVVPLEHRAVRIILATTPTKLFVSTPHIRDRKGIASGMLTAPVAFMAGTGDLVINEIMYEPRNDPYDGHPDQIEFIELVNLSERLISVSELARTRAVNEHGDADTLRFGRPLTSLEPGGFLVVAPEDSVEIRLAYPEVIPDEHSTFITAPGLTLLNSGDRFRLHNRLQDVLDEVHYAPSWHHPDLTDRRGVSLERLDVALSSSDPINWSSSASVDGASPGSSNSIALVPTDKPEAYGIEIEPSPFSPDGDGVEDATIITYRLRATTANIRVRIFDVNGFEMRELVPSDLATGEGRLVWDGRDNSGRLLRVGVYIVVFESAAGRGQEFEVYKRPVVLARKL